MSFSILLAVDNQLFELVMFDFCQNIFFEQSLIVLPILDLRIQFSFTNLARLSGPTACVEGLTII